MSQERPSPFTIPEPSGYFKEGLTAGPQPAHSVTLGNLLVNLRAFATNYELGTKNVDEADVYEKAYWRGVRDANAAYERELFRAARDIDRIRGLVLSRFGEELTIGSAQKLLGELIRSAKGTLSIPEAERLLLGEVADSLETPPPPAEGARKEASQKQKATKGKNINARMAGLFNADPVEKLSWTATKWAAHLGCSSSAVKETHTWDTVIKMARITEQAGRMPRLPKRNGRREKADSDQRS